MEEHLDPLQFGVTPALFREWRAPRFGKANPEKLTSKVWEWLLYSRLSGYASTQMLNGPSAQAEGPTWSFDRFGQSVTGLPDGRTVFVGGEHEDHYDPDFYIYNDVAVTHPDRSVDFYCYRKSDFPPTDFHTATLVGETIILIGSLGYLGERMPGNTQLYGLDLASFEIQRRESHGSSPGWIHGHTATLSEDEQSIVVTGGKRIAEDGRSLRENIDDWKLDLKAWRWERLTHRNWTQFEIRRKDKGNMHLFEFRNTLFNMRFNFKDQYQEGLSRLAEALGYQPDVKRIEDLYHFALGEAELQKEEEAYNLYYVFIDGVKARFKEEFYSLEVVIEGQLSSEKQGAIKRQLLEKLSTLENSPCELEEYR